MADIDNTGERILLEKETPAMIARHFFAYSFAWGYSGSKRVLDIACGEGYGADYLSENAALVTGADYDNEIIYYAQNKYKRNNLRFIRQDACKLEFPSGSFDLVCSFQTIEHIKDALAFLSEAKRVLSPGGIAVISTPNIKDSSPDSSSPLNKYHVKEYTSDEFEGLLKGFFSQVKIYGLKRSFRQCFYRRLKKSGLLKWLPDPINPVSIYFKEITNREYLLTDKGLSIALDFIAVCKK